MVQLDTFSELNNGLRGNLDCLFTISDLHIGLLTGALIPLITLAFNSFYQKKIQQEQHKHENKINRDQKEFDIRKEVLLESIPQIAKSQELLLNCYSKSLDELNNELSKVGLGAALSKIHLISSVQLIEAILEYSREFTKVLQNILLLLVKRDSIKNTISWLSESIELQYQSVKGLSEDYQRNAFQETEKLGQQKSKLEDELVALNLSLSKNICEWSFNLVPFTTKALLLAKKDLGFENSIEEEKYIVLMNDHLKDAKKSQQEFIQRIELELK